MFLGFNSLLSKQVAGNLTQKRLKYEDFLTKQTVYHYKFQTRNMRKGSETEALQSKSYGKV
jgi:hypothetical protein